VGAITDVDYRERWELKDFLIGQRLERRILLIHVLLALVLVAFLFNFWYLQGVKGVEYARLAEGNTMRKIPLKPTRGWIYDRDGQVIAATRPSLDLLVRQEQVDDLPRMLDDLAPILTASPRDLADVLRGEPDFEPVVVGRDVGLLQLAWIESRRERFPAIEIRETARRFYPEAAIIAHTIGYVGQVNENQLRADKGRLKSGDIVGKSGVERAFDDDLRGDRGWHLVSVNAVGRQVGETRVGQEASHGNRMQLTIDLDLQRALVEGLGVETGAGVFLDPWTGEVLAIASTPHFDPNRFADGFDRASWEKLQTDPRRPLHDRSIASFYAPGSTFKVVMAAAGLETGIIGEDDRVYCNGSATYYKRRRLCWKRGGHGWVNIRKALAESCNVYFYELGQKLGIEKIHDFGDRFGLGRLTGVGLSGEEAGILGNSEWKRKHRGEQWYPGDTISVSIGQGLLAVTPMQMARMIGGVATNGKLPTPTLVLGSQKLEPIGLRPTTLRLLRAGLADAVSRGTATRATDGTFTVAGKTGTAQVYKHSAGIDADKLPKAERDHAWFVGYAPADKPRIAFAIVVENGGHGGTIAAPIARSVLEIFFSSERPDPASRAGVGRSPSPVHEPATTVR